MPSLFWEGKINNAFYSPAGDTVVVDRDFLKEKALNPQEIKSVLVHELRHKAQERYHPSKMPKYDAITHANYTAPEVFAECQKAGLSDLEIKRLLPHDTDNNLFAVFAVEKPELQYATSKAGDAAEWVSHPLDMLAANLKATLQDTQCSTALSRINHTQKAVLQQMSYDFLGNKRAAEYDADMATKKAGLATTFISALEKLHTKTLPNGEGIIVNTRADQEWMEDHPTLEHRIDALSHKPDSKGKNGKHR